MSHCPIAHHAALPRPEDQFYRDRAMRYIANPAFKKVCHISGCHRGTVVRIVKFRGVVAKSQLVKLDLQRCRRGVTQVIHKNGFCQII